MDYTTIGIDVSKAKLDIFMLPKEEYLSLSNDKSGFKDLKKVISKLENKRILLESTGCYHINVQRFLIEHGYPVYTINPKLIRDYAKSCGKLAKTDKLDAKMIARYGETHDIRETNEIDLDLERFRMLETRREQIISTISQEKTRKEKSSFLEDKSICKYIDKTILFLEKQLEEIDSELEAIITNNNQLKDKYDRIMAVEGVGKATTYVLLAHLPELGKLSKREIAALIGLAPMNCDSGAMRGQRHIRGGRLNVRNALYMACVVTVMRIKQKNQIITDSFKTILAYRISFLIQAVIATLKGLPLAINLK